MKDRYQGNGRQQTLCQSFKKGDREIALHCRPVSPAGKVCKLKKYKNTVDDSLGSKGLNKCVAVWVQCDFDSIIDRARYSLKKKLDMWTEHFRLSEGDLTLVPWDKERDRGGGGQAGRLEGSFDGSKII